MANLNTGIGPERVQVFDVPIGTVQLPGVPTSVTAFLISTSKAGAPENVATKVTNFGQFIDAFGDADEVAHDGYYAVQGFFDNGGTGNTAIIVNVGDNATAADFIGSVVDNSGLRALDSEDILGLVTVPGLPLTLAYLVHGSLIDYTETVRAEFGAVLSTSFSLLAIPKEIGKADSDKLVTNDGKFVSVSGAGPYDMVLDDGAAGAVDLSAVTPGMIITNNAGTYTGVISVVNDGTDTITVSPDPTTFFSATDDVNILIPSAIKYKDVVINNPSRVASWYFNNPLVTDASSAADPGDTLAVDPTGHVAGIMARIDSNIAIGGPSHAPAGIRFASMVGIQGLSLLLSERVDAAPLRLAFINRITSFPGSGNIVFGGYTAGGVAVTADEQLIQVMRTLQFIKGSLERGLRGFLWENFSPANQSAIQRAIESFLRNNIHLFPEGLPEAQQFRVINIEPTQDELDQGLLRVRIQVRPNKAVRYIEISLEFPIPVA